MISQFTCGWGCCLSVTFLILSSGQPGAQDRAGQYSPADIESGAKLYANQCTSCHGLSGDSIGGVDLASNKFRRATSDRDLMNLIEAGIPDGGMPAHSFSQAQLVTLVAYLRNMRNAVGDTLRRGDASRGKALFEGKGACTNCHSVNGQGSRSAPDLSNIGGLRSADAIRHSLLDPSAAMIPINRPIRATTKSGTVITGRRLNEDTFTVQLADERGRLVSLIKAELREYTILTRSPMPSYEGKLTNEELGDLLSDLAVLKGS